jgi:hypothetical protein
MSVPVSMNFDNNMDFFNPVHGWFQDMDFSSWDLDFDSFAVPRVESSDPSPQTTAGMASKSHAGQDPARRHAAYKRSPWLWEPDPTDYVSQATEGLHLNEDDIAQSPAFDQFLTSTNKLKMSTATRDRLFSIVLAEHRDSKRVPSFPSLELLNYLLQTHFAQDEYQYDSWIHAATFEPENSIPELLGAIIANGASFIAVPSVWQFGLALQEVVRQRLAPLVGDGLASQHLPQRRKRLMNFSV